MKKTLFSFIFIIFLLLIGRYYYHIEAEKKIHQIISQLSPGINIRYTDMSVNLKGEISLENLTAFNQTGKALFQAAEFEIIDYQILNNIPVKLEIKIKSLKFKVLKNTRESSFGLYNLGYKKLAANFHFKYYYDDYSNRLFLNLETELEDFAHIELMLDLANVEIDQWRYYFQNPNSLLFIEGQLKYIELGFVTRLLKYVKKNKGLTDAEFIQHIKSRIKRIKESDTMFAEDKKGYLKKWEQFVLNPKKLEIQLKVDEGISFRQIQQIRNKPSLIKDLKVLIDVNQ